MIYEEFTIKELTAISSLAINIANSDGARTQKDFDYIVSVMRSFGVDELDISVITVDAFDISECEAIAIISQLNFEQKKYISAFLGSITLVSDEIKKSRIDKWAQYSKECNFPYMTLKEAYNIMMEI